MTANQNSHKTEAFNLQGLMKNFQSFKQQRRKFDELT